MLLRRGRMADIALDEATPLMLAAAEARGIPARLRRMGPNWGVRFRIGRRNFYYRDGILQRGAGPFGLRRGPHVNGAAVDDTRDKARTRARLTAAGVPMPRGAVFFRGDAEAALAFSLALGTAVCIKPRDGEKAASVYPGLRGKDEIAAAIDLVFSRWPVLLVEETIGVAEIRVVCLGGRATMVRFSSPARVEGDGRSTIGELLAAFNAERRRRGQRSHEPLPMTDDLVDVLVRQGFTLDTVPGPGRSVRLTRTANVAAGGTSHTDCDRLHPSYLRAAERAVAAIPGLAIAGVDLRLDDPEAPAASGNHFVLEVNSSPGLVSFHEPWVGQPVDLAGQILDFLAANAPQAAGAATA